MEKRVFFEKREFKATQIKGYVDIETDYIQLYKNFAKACKRINSPMTFKLLHWLLANRMGSENGLQMQSLLDAFNNHLNEDGDGEDFSIVKSTLYRCLEELVTVGAITKVDRGHYYANPDMFWGEEISKRLEHIKTRELHKGEDPISLDHKVHILEEKEITYAKEVLPIVIDNEGT